MCAVLSGCSEIFGTSSTEQDFHPGLRTPLLQTSTGGDIAFGDVYLGSTARQTVTLKTNGLFPITALSALSPNAPFTYTGGTYPGTGGNCANSLAPGQACTVAIEVAPTSRGALTHSLSFSYSYGEVAKSSQITLTANAATGESGSADVQTFADSTGVFSVREGVDSYLPNSVHALPDGRLYSVGCRNNGVNYFLTIQCGRALWVDTSGRVLASGMDNDAIIVRVLSSGQLDTSFATTGKLISDAIVAGHDIREQADGKIWVVGGSASGPLNMGVIRLKTDGTLDTSYFWDFSGRTDQAKHIGIQNDGKIVITGSSYTGIFTDAKLAMIRFDTAGTLDTSFFTSGKMLTTEVIGYVASIFVQGAALALATDGKFVVGGVPNFTLARFLTSGSLDTSWNTAGKVTQSHFESAGLTAIAITSDGNVVGLDGSAYQFWLTRWLSNGSIDSSFGTAGTATTTRIGSIELIDGGMGRNLTLTPSGKIVACGTILDPTLSYNSFAIARFWP